MRVLLTGATGCLGGAVLRRSEGRSDLEVLATARGQTAAAPTRATRWMASSLAGLPGRLAEIGPVDACVHAAAVVHRPEVPEAEVRQVNVDQTVALARRLAETSPGARFVFISSIAALDPDRSPYADSKADAEAALAAVGQDTGLDVVTLRLATVYGPDDRGNIGSLARMIAQGVYLRTAPPEVRKTLVWSEAAASAILAAVDPSRECRSLAVVADPRPYELGEIEDALAEALGARPPWRLPFPFPSVLGAAGTAVERVTGLNPPFSLAKLRTLRRDVAVPVAENGALTNAVKRSLEGTSLVDRLRSAYGGSRHAGAG